jgi:2-oxoglutarate dehydrogenase E2 component (dihydrolipoamide succinyltransferase)
MKLPSEVSGILVEQLFGKDDLVQVGQTIYGKTKRRNVTTAVAEEVTQAVAEVSKTVEAAQESVAATASDFFRLEKFFSISKKYCFGRRCSVDELERITGTGKKEE